METIRSKLDRLRGRSARGEKVSFDASALLRFANGGIHFLLAAVLAGAAIFGGYAPFGVALVGAAGSGAVKPAAIAPMPRLAHKSAAMPPAISLCSGRRETALPEKYFIGFFLAMLLIPLLF